MLIGSEEEVGEKVCNNKIAGKKEGISKGRR